VLMPFDPLVRGCLSRKAVGSSPVAPAILPSLSAGIRPDRGLDVGDLINSSSWVNRFGEHSIWVFSGSCSIYKLWLYI
jgi:hypothetical protein